MLPVAIAKARMFSKFDDSNKNLLDWAIGNLPIPHALCKSLSSSICQNEHFSSKYLFPLSKYSLKTSSCVLTLSTLVPREASAFLMLSFVISFNPPVEMILSNTPFSFLVTTLLLNTLAHWPDRLISVISSRFLSESATKAYLGCS